MITFTIPGEPGVSYRQINGFDWYVVGDDGSVWSCRSLNGQGYGNWHRLKGCMSNGYIRVNLRKDCVLIKKSVHRLVLSAFKGDQSELDVRHLNGRRSDNRLINLEWGTDFENAQDRESHGMTLRGERHGRAKLVSSEVLEIRRLCAIGASKTQVADQFGVARTTLRHIVSGRNWRHEL